MGEDEREEEREQVDYLGEVSCKTSDLKHKAGGLLLLFVYLRFPLDGGSILRVAPQNEPRLSIIYYIYFLLYPLSR